MKTRNWTDSASKVFGRYGRREWFECVFDRQCFTCASRRSQERMNSGNLPIILKQIKRSVFLT
jgi:hypothetical protein